MSQLAKQLIAQSLATKNPHLDLGNCGLKGNKPCLALLEECTHLKTLVFSSEWWEWNEVSQSHKELV